MKGVILIGNINQLAQNLNKKINEILKRKLEILKQKAVQDLKNAVETNVYFRYSPIEYERTEQLIRSITASDIKVEGNQISFEVYFDPGKLSYYTFSGDTTYKGLSLGHWVPYWLDEGHSQPGGQYPAADFIADAIEKIKQDLRNEIEVEVKRIGKR